MYITDHSNDFNDFMTDNGATQMDNLKPELDCHWLNKPEIMDRAMDFDMADMMFGKKVNNQLGFFLLNCPVVNET